jgi:hypothetical protein
MKVRAAICAGTVALVTAGGSAAAARTLTFTPGAYVAAPRFHVTYSGRGEWSTTYHSTPANPGANPDTNDAHDSSSERWSLSFIESLSARRAGTYELSEAGGSTRARGRISHSHLDGIYAADNVSTSCEVAARTPLHARLPAAIEVTHLRGARGLRVTALDPLSEVLTLLPQQCPGQGDSLDGLADNYFTPGFSFAAGYGPDRWFRSRSTFIPLAVLRRAVRLSVPLGPGPSAAPPVNCAVPYPAWQRCHTAGTWRGTVTLRRVAG